MSASKSSLGLPLSVSIFASRLPFAFAQPMITLVSQDAPEIRAGWMQRLNSNLESQNGSENYQCYHHDRQRPCRLHDFTS
eukprot:3163984-Amphidinium_carterae.1